MNTGTVLVKAGNFTLDPTFDFTGGTLTAFGATDFDVPGTSTLAELNGARSLTVEGVLTTGQLFAVNATISAGATVNVTWAGVDGQVYNVYGTLNAAPTANFSVFGASTFSGRIIGGGVYLAYGALTVQGTPTVAQGALWVRAVPSSKGAVTMVDGRRIHNATTLTMGAGMIRGVLP
jgi:hypothetical protein